jgi:alkylated DNA repair dioxygenase AlkB
MIERMFAPPADLSWQGCLFGLDDPHIDHTFAAAEFVELSHGAWVEHVPRWLGGADLVFAELVARLAWRQRQVVMWGDLVHEPRLTAWWSELDGAPEALPVLAEMRTALSRRYQRSFDSIGCNLYRDGRDSVAWHRDRIRHLDEPVVAIVSVGAPRPLLMRPHGGGPSRGWLLGQGDLFVMGGTCQHTWEHTVPKVAHAAGPRLSITYRHDEDPPD